MENKESNVLDLSFDEIFLQPLEEVDTKPNFDSFIDTEASSLYLNFDFTNDSLIFEINEPEKIEVNSKPTIKRQTSPSGMIGTLSQLQRHQKIMRYLAKKNIRNWHKKIHYTCRKKVADQRIRYKGRFVTKEQALCLQRPPTAN